MLLKNNKILVGLYVVFVFHQFFERILNSSLGVLDSFLDPLLCFPILLPILEFEWKRYYPVRGQLSLSELSMLTLIFAALFEFGFPRINPNFVFDWLDFPCYLLGFLFYVFFLRNQFLYSIYSDSKN